MNTIDTITEAVRDYLVETMPPANTRDAVIALLAKVPVESLDGLSPPAQEAAIRRTLRALDHYVRVD